jgi:hypothetical protein
MTNPERSNLDLELERMLAGAIVDESDKDWTYLLEKEPQSNHQLFAKIMREKLGNEAVNTASPEQMIYWLLAMHRWMQKTQANRDRSEFHGRTVGSVLKGSATLAERLAPRDESELLVTPVPLAVGEAPKPKRPARKPRAPRKVASPEAISA